MFADQTTNLFNKNLWKKFLKTESLNSINEKSD